MLQRSYDSGRIAMANARLLPAFSMSYYIVEGNSWDRTSSGAGRTSDRVLEEGRKEASCKRRPVLFGGKIRCKERGNAYILYSTKKSGPTNACRIWTAFDKHQTQGKLTTPSIRSQLSNSFTIVIDLYPLAICLFATTC